jgi:hypothetical protein
MWTVIMFFGRGHVETFTNLTKQQAQEMVRIAVFNNEDCINVHIFKQEGKG